MLAALATWPTGWVLTSPKPQDAPWTGKRYYHDQRQIIWQNASSFDLSEAVLRWGLPADPFALDAETGNGDALSSGIAWALHPAFCDELLGRFPEENFNVNVPTSRIELTRVIPRLPLIDISLQVYDALKIDSLFLSCDDLRRSIADAWKTWSINHAKLRFFDVTEKCAEAGAIVLDEKLKPRCKHAEVLINPGLDEGGADLAAFVVNSYDGMDRSPYLTSGVELPWGDGLRRSRMQVSTDICWYLVQPARVESGRLPSRRLTLRASRRRTRPSATTSTAATTTATTWCSSCASSSRACTSSRARSCCGCSPARRSPSAAPPRRCCSAARPTSARPTPSTCAVARGATRCCASARRCRWAGCSSASSG
jgi:hypothetical protein